MSDVRDLLEDTVRNRQSIAGMWYGLVTAPAPLLETDPVYVIVPDIDHNTKFGPCFWSPRATKTLIDVSQAPEAVNIIEFATIKLPIVGSECLVIFDNRQNTWVVEWE